MGINSINSKDLNRLENILIIGSGGRENALAWAIQKNELIKKVYLIPGNAGSERINKCKRIRLDISDSKSLVEKLDLLKIDEQIAFKTVHQGADFGSPVAEIILRNVEECLIVPVLDDSVQVQSDSASSLPIAVQIKIFIESSPILLRTVRLVENAPSSFIEGLEKGKPSLGWHSLGSPTSTMDFDC